MKRKRGRPKVPGVITYVRLPHATRDFLAGCARQMRTPVSVVIREIVVEWVMLRDKAMPDYPKE